MKCDPGLGLPSHFHLAALKAAAALSLACGLAGGLRLPGQVVAGQQGAEAEVLLSQGRYSEAMDAFEAALKGSSRDPGARQGEISAAIAWALQQTSQQLPYAALQTLERGNAHAPNDAELLLDLGVEATMLQQFTLAAESLHQSLQLRPNHPKTLYALARLATEQQHLPEAEETFKKYLALRPDDASAYFGLGHIYAMQQRREEAQAAFEQSLKLRPQQSESYYQLGQLSLDAHQDVAAEGFFAKALERDPKHAGALTGMGQIAFRAKDYGKAEQLLAEAERCDPNYQTPHYFRGLALAKLGRKDEADEELRRGDSRPHATKPGEYGQTGEGQTRPAQQAPGL